MVPITSEEIRSPYYRHFVRRMTEPEQSVYEAVRQWTAAEKALLPGELNLLFDGEPGRMENGISRLPDGSAAIAFTMDMPGVTPEMFCWWFAWHSLEPMRFKIWNREEHYSCRNLSPKRALDRSLPMAQRCRNIICEVEEDLGYGPEKSLVHYRAPEDFGFDREKLSAFPGCVICAGDERSPVIAVHFLSPTDSGSRLRTRIWLGCCMGSGGAKVRMPQGAFIPPEPARAHYEHIARDFTNLAAMLPELYEQFGKDF